MPISNVDRRRKYRDDPNFKRQVARIDAKSKIEGVLLGLPDMSESDPEALGRDRIREIVMAESPHFNHGKEKNERRPVA